MDMDKKVKDIISNSLGKILRVKRTAYSIMALSAVFLFLSCNNIFDSAKKEDVTLNPGEKVILRGTIPVLQKESGEKSAVPTVNSDLADSNYTVKITLNGQDKTTYASLAFTSSEVSFSITLNTGRNEIEVYVQITDTQISSSPVKILSCKKTIQVAANTPRYLSENFILEKIQDGTKKGKVRLEVTVPTAANPGNPSIINYATAALIDDDQTKIDEWKEVQGITDGTVVKGYDRQSSKFYFFGDDVNSVLMKSGSYKIQFNFYDNSTSKNILYSMIETVKVYNGLCTNTWCNEAPVSGMSNDPIGNTGEFKITDAIISDFAITSIFVDPQNGLDINSGTSLGKFKTLQKALDTAVLRNDLKTNAEINIFLCGNISGQVPLMLNCSSKALTLNIKSDSASKRTISGKNDASDSLLKITGKSSSDTTINIDGIDLKNNNGCEKGGALFIKNAKVTLSNLDVCENQTTAKGGGVYLEGTSSSVKAILDIKNDVNISQNTIDNSDSGNTDDAAGAGIYASEYSTVVLESGNGTIYGNHAYASGNNKACGGAVYISNNASFVVNGGNVKNNIAKNNDEGKKENGRGGSVYVSPEGSFSVSGNSLFLSDDDLPETGDNDIYLSDDDSNNASVEIASNFSGAKNLYLNLQEPYRNKTIVSGSGKGTLNTKFSFVGDCRMYKVTTEGKTDLKNYITNIYVTAAGTDPSGNSIDDLTWFDYICFPDYLNPSSGNSRPFKSIDKALEFITWQGNKTSYTITIGGTLTGPQCIEDKASSTNPVSLSSNATSITLTGINSGELDGGYTKNTDKKGRTLKIDTSVPVTITDLTVTGGYTNVTENDPANFGAGIYLTSGTTLKLGDNSVICGNHAYRGGGVYVESGATLFMYGKSLIGDSLTSTDCSSLDLNNYPTINAAYKHGGGIYNAGTVYIGYSYLDNGNPAGEQMDTTEQYGIRRNYAEEGGGISNFGGTLVIRNGYVSYNKASNGGGIYCNGNNTTLKGGNIVGNRASSGGGIAVQNRGEAVIEGNSVYIQSNYASQNGGGVFLGPGNLKMCGGMIGGSGSQNNAGNAGGAVFVNGTLKISKGAVIYRGNEKVNDIYLPGGKKVEVTGKLTATFTPTITPLPANMKTGTEVLSYSTTKWPSDAEDWTLSEASAKFTLAGEKSEVYAVDTSGKITGSASKVLANYWDSASEIVLPYESQMLQNGYEDNFDNPKSLQSLVGKLMFFKLNTDENDYERYAVFCITSVNGSTFTYDFGNLNCGNHTCGSVPGTINIAQKWDQNPDHHVHLSLKSQDGIVVMSDEMNSLDISFDGESPYNFHIHIDGTEGEIGWYIFD